MSYNAEELFELYEINGRYCVTKYLKSNDASVTELEIPAEYDGLPVVKTGSFAFWDCKYLCEVYVPDSVEWIDAWAFQMCPELRAVRLPRRVKIRPPSFVDCPKLPPEAVLAGLVGSPEDMSAPIKNAVPHDWNGLLRPEVFELVIKYDSFREIGTEMLFKEIVRRGLFLQFEMLEKAGRSPELEHTDRLIEFSSENGYTEMTAFLLDYKNRKFGFDKKDNYVI